mmetsp:Transcript_19080/g.26680  ORF Transcript_19080/g.26680 Transcript_19080/m.26680 type:complete len:181 (-) Transcript_19080:195-737(-)
MMGKSWRPGISFTLPFLIIEFFDADAKHIKVGWTLVGTMVKKRTSIFSRPPVESNSLLGLNAMFRMQNGEKVTACSNKKTINGKKPDSDVLGICSTQLVDMSQDVIVVMRVKVLLHTRSMILLHNEKHSCIDVSVEATSLRCNKDGSWRNSPKLMCSLDMIILHCPRTAHKVGDILLIMT